MDEFIEYNLEDKRANKSLKRNKQDAGYAEFWQTIHRHGSRAQVILLKTWNSQTNIHLRFPDGFERNFITYAGGDIQVFLQTFASVKRPLMAILLDQGGYAGSILVLDQGGLINNADARASIDLINKMHQYYPSRWRAFKEDANVNCENVWTPDQFREWMAHSNELKDVFKLAGQDIYLFSQIMTPPLCPPLAYEIMALIPEYNGFNSPKVIHFLEKYEDKMMAIVFGFDGSPEMTISFPFWESQRYGAKKLLPAESRRIPQVTADKWAREMMTAIQQEPFEPEEIGYNPSWRDLRFWWD